LKIAFPQIELVLLESTGKKADFLKHLVEALSLEKIRVITGRAEEFAQSPVFRETFDASVARALAYMAVLAELTLPFCRIGGRLVAQKKGDLGEEIALSASAIAILGGGPPVIRQVILPGLIDNRCLVVVDKISATPPQYPRHVGIPAKRPLSPH
jgi:16S rRNA (guanine527-N7)-methyltransferase